MAVNLAPFPILGTLFVPGGNVVASGGQLFTYTAGTTTKQTTFTTSSGLVARTNPIVLDSGGNIPGSREIWLTAGVLYDLTLAPSTDTDPPASPYWTVANVGGVNDLSNILTEWVPSGSTATFISGTSFSLTGDQTGTLTVNRRVKTVNTGGTVFSTITSSVFGASTTVGITNDSGSLDAGLSALSYGLVSANNNSLPHGVYTVSTLSTGVGSSSTPSLNFSDPSSGFWRRNTNVITISNVGADTHEFQQQVYAQGSQNVIKWGNSINISGIGAFDTGVTRNAAGVVEINNGTAGVLAELTARDFQGRSGAGAPTITNITTGAWALWRDTAASTTRLYYNNAGTIMSSAAFS